MLELTVHEIKDFLPGRLECIESLLRVTDRNTVLAISKTRPCGIGELVQRHTDRSTVLDIRLVLGVVQFSFEEEVQLSLTLSKDRV